MQIKCHNMPSWVVGLMSVHANAGISFATGAGRHDARLSTFNFWKPHTPVLTTHLFMMHDPQLPANEMGTFAPDLMPMIAEKLLLEPWVVTRVVLAKIWGVLQHGCIID